MEEATTPAIPEMIAAEPILIGPFDRYWLTELVISLPEIGGEANVSAIFTPYRVADDEITIPPLPPVRLTADNLLEAATQDPDLMLAIQAIGKAVVKMGISQGLLAPPALTRFLS